MAAPIPYAPTYSFAGFQSLNPDRPLPAPSLDVQLASIQASLDSLIAALADIRRADGNIENGSVSLDALDPDIKVLLQGTEPRTTVADLAPSAFAAQVEAEAGVANDKLMTPLRTAQAITAQRPLATQVQATTGTDNATVSTPLRVAQAVDALRPYADQAEAEAGVATDVVLSPARLVQALAALRPAFTRTLDLTWSAAGAGAAVAINVPVTGAAVGDRVIVTSHTALAAGLILSGRVASADTVTLTIYNATAGSLTPHGGSATPYSITCLRY